MKSIQKRISKDMEKKTIQRSKLQTSKKGQALNSAITGIIGLVVIGIVLAIGGTILGDVHDSTDNARAQNLTNDSLSALDNFGDLTPTLGIVIVATVILGLVVGAFRQVG